MSDFYNETFKIQPMDAKYPINIMTPSVDYLEWVERMKDDLKQKQLGEWLETYTEQEETNE